MWFTVIGTWDSKYLFSGELDLAPSKYVCSGLKYGTAWGEMMNYDKGSIKWNFLCVNLFLFFFSLQVFEGIQDLLNMINIGFCVRETKAMVHITVTSKPKLRALFLQASSLDFLEKKKSNGERAEVIVTKERPFSMSFSKKNERISVRYCFKWWNRFGICQ